MKPFLFLLVLGLCFLGASPLLVGVIGRYTVETQLRENASKDYAISLVSQELGYFQSSYQFQIETHKGNRIGLELVTRNVPDPACLTSLRLCFPFTGKFHETRIPTAQGELRIKEIPVTGVASIPRALWFRLTPVMEKAPGDKITVEHPELLVEVSDERSRVVGSVAKVGLELGPVGGVLEEVKLDVSRMNAQREARGELQLKLSSPLMKNPGGVAFTGEMVVRNLPDKPQKLSVSEIHRLKLTSEFKLELSTGKSSVKVSGQAQTIKDEFDLILPLIKGAVKIFIAPEDRSLPAVQMALAAGAPFLMNVTQNNGVRFDGSEAEFTFERSGDETSVNDTLFFSCQDDRNSQIDRALVRALPREKILTEAMDDLLWQTQRREKGTSYCRLKYFASLVDRNDHRARLLLELYRYKFNYYLLTDPLARADQERIIVRLAESVNDEDLNALVSQFHCVQDLTSKACVDERALPVASSPDSPLRKLMALSFAPTPAREDLALLPEAPEQAGDLTALFAYFRILVAKKIALAYPELATAVAQSLEKDALSLGCDSGEVTLKGCQAIRENPKEEKSQDLAWITERLQIPEEARPSALIPTAVGARKTFLEAAAERAFTYEGLLLGKIPELCRGKCPLETAFYSGELKAKTEIHVLAVTRSVEEATVVRLWDSLRPQALVLSAAAPVSWKLISAPGAHLTKVFLLGAKESAVEAPEGVRVERLELPALETMSPKDFSRELVLAIGGRPLSFQGSTEWKEFSVPFYRNSRDIVDLEASYRELLKKRQVKKISSPFIDIGEKLLLARGGSLPYLPRPLAVKEDLQGVTFAPLTGKFYGHDGEAVYEIDPATGASVRLLPPSNLPSLVQPGGIAFNAKDSLLYIGTKASSGANFTLDLARNKWRSFPVKLGERSVFALTFDPVSSKIQGLCLRGLCTFDQDFNVAESLSLRVPAREVSQLMLRARLDPLKEGILLTLPRPDRRLTRYLVDKESGELKLVDE